MSEQTTEETATTADADVTEQSQQGEPADKPLGAAGEKALKAERARADAAEKRIREIEQAQMSDLERAQAQAQEYQEAATKAATEALRWRVAAKHGISDEDAETFLTGTDEDTITRQAERLAALGNNAPAGPRADLTQGSGREKPGTTPQGQFADFLTHQLTGK